MRAGVAHAVHPRSVGESVHGLVAVGGHRGVGGVGPRHLVDHPGDAQVVGDLETLGQTALIIASHGGQVVARLAARHGALRPCRENVDEIYLFKYRAKADLHWEALLSRHGSREGLSGLRTSEFSPPPSPLLGLAELAIENTPESAWEAGESLLLVSRGDSGKLKTKI